MPGTSSSSPSARKREQGEQCEGGGDGWTNKRSRRDSSPYSTSKKNRKRSRRHSGTTKHQDTHRKSFEGEQGSLRITIDGRSSLGPSPPVNHTYSMSRPPLLGMPSTPTSEFPREPHQSPYHAPPPPDPSFFTPPQVWHGGGHPHSASPASRRGGEWHHNSPEGHTFLPSPSHGQRGMVSRSLSAGDHHLPSHPHRRHSEHFDGHNSRHQDGLLATPTYPPPHNHGRLPLSDRGRLLSHRGFELSVEAAHRYGRGREMGGRPPDLYSPGRTGLYGGQGHGDRPPVRRF